MFVQPSLKRPPAPPLDLSTRCERLEELEGATLDVLVIGGGITGAGIARDAAMRGLKTALVEKADLAYGTSSASSKLIHGGLRYLEHGQVGLVWQSVSERHRLRQLAPHLARPIPFVFPIYGKKPRPLWMVATGLWIYDTLALFRSYRLHRTLWARRTAALEPAMATEGLSGCVHYYDCLTDDSRLTLATAMGAHQAGAAVLTYCRVTGFVVRRSQVCGVEVLDRHSGQVRVLNARVVVNATGPWTDRTLGLRGNRARILRPTKGTHCIVSRDRLPIRQVVCLFNEDDRRMLFAVPWGNRVLLGTTDTDFQGDFDDVHCNASDADYILATANRYFPDSRLTPADVLGSYAGLRPLIADEQGGGPAGAVSREHTIEVTPDGLVTVAGGKLTTYRAMAAEVLEVIASRLRSEGVHVGGCPTASVKLPGGAGIRARGAELQTLGHDGQEAEAELEEHLGTDVVAHLKQSYGGTWLDVAGRAAEDSDLGRRVVDDLPYVWAELDHGVAHEAVITPRDFLRRRTQLELRDLPQTWAIAPAVCARMGALLGWTEQETAGHLQRWREEAGPALAWRDGGL